MIRHERDYYRWRLRFAWRPRKIGVNWIWLEAFAWRPLRFEEYKAAIPPWPMGPWMSSWREYVIRSSGYVAWREEVHSLSALAPSFSIWHRPPLKLKIASAS